MAAEKSYSVPVVFADRFFMSPASLAEISSLGGYLWADATDSSGFKETLKNCSGPVRVIVSEYVPINGSVLEQVPGLRGVISYGAGYDHIDVASLNAHRVQVCNCRGENAEAVAELTFGLLLALLRRIPRAERWVRQDEWLRAGRAFPEWVMGRELWRKNLGIIGLGQIGSKLARIASGFEMKIIAYDPFVKAKNEIKNAPLEEVLSRADILSLHIPLTPQTAKMIGRKEISLLKPGAVLVNTSRGGIIDESALVDALKEGRIAGAALDVFSSEPISARHPLAQFENVILSPHMGAMTEEAGERLSSAVARQVRDILEGREPECLIR